MLYALQCTPPTQFSKYLENLSTNLWFIFVLSFAINRTEMSFILLPFSFHAFFILDNSYLIISHLCIRSFNFYFYENKADWSLVRSFLVYFVSTMTSQFSFSFCGQLNSEFSDFVKLCLQVSGSIKTL